MDNFGRANGQHAAPAPAARRPSDWWAHQPPVHRLIRALFWLVAAVFLLVVGLLFFLKINETATAHSGSIVAENHPVELLAQAEGRVSSVRVRDGDRVRQGDTLLVLENEGLENAVARARQDTAAARRNIEMLQKMLGNLSDQLAERRQGTATVRSGLVNESSSAEVELRALQNQVNFAENKLAINRDRLQKDRQLLNQGVISELEFGKKQGEFLEEQRVFSELKKVFEQKKLAKSNFPNLVADRLAQQQLTILGGENERLNAQKLLAQEEAALLAAARELDLQEKEMGKLVVTAPADGSVSQLFNARQGVNVVSKGQSLLRLSPAGDARFTARVSIEQSQLKNVRTGQPALVKVDAFDHWRFGPVRGELTFVGPDTSAAFYALVRLDAASNPSVVLQNGLRVKADIVTRRVRLWEFVWGKLFAGR